MVAIAPWEGVHYGALAAAMVVGICTIFVCVVSCVFCGACNF